MKKIVLIIALVFCFFGYSQDKQIEGIGIFKVGKTKITVIDSLVSSGYELRSCSNLYDCSDYKVKGKYIYEMIKDTVKPNNQPMPLIKEHRSFVIGEYNVAGIKLSPILHFYNDVLYKIKTSGLSDLNLQDALKEKYNPTLDYKTKEVTCKSRFGEFKEKESYFTIEYRDDLIYATSFLDIYYDDECKKQSRNFTYIYIKKEDSVVSLKEEEITKKSEEKQKIEKKKLLDKL